ncbi:MAG TPA: hypothetical protein PLG89_04425 [Arenimonas sp.]|nr:hypothetical protein [Arenimonas sp.]
MPAADAPLRGRLETLQARADAGDSLAACRLGIELLRCAALGNYHPEHDVQMANQEAEQEAKGDLLAANTIAAGRLLHAELREACSVVPESLAGRAHHYVRQAALAGQPEAMIRYARGETLLTGTAGLAYIATPAFDQWRREARPVLMHALHAGHPAAALILAKAHGGNDSHLAMLLPHDGVEARASVMLARRLFGDDPALARGLFGDNPASPPLDSTQDPDVGQSHAAEQMADQWHARNFNGRRFVLAEHTAALLPLHRRPGWDDGSAGWPGKPGPESCAPAAAAAP